jgi:2-oxoglutarate ferredoxin oxidoreductase subunit alpha
MTVTSGPGLSLMMEHLGYAVMTETPCVIIDVQRGGPSTGLPTLPAQADMMQIKWGSHGDYEIIALTPDSPQECFDLMITAFNLSEQYRSPVFFMMDEVVGHMTEKVTIPPADRIEVVERRWTAKKPGDYQAFEAAPTDAPDMVKAGDGHRIHVTGLTHDERGYPSVSPTTQKQLVERLINKIKLNRDKLVDVRMDGVEGADLVVVSYGITSRVVRPAVLEARRRGLKVGLLRLVVTWPFPDRVIADLSGKVKTLLTVEMNMGQMGLEVERAAAGRCRCRTLTHAGGAVHEPAAVLEAILEAAKS